jgi:hypothetical protein
MSRRQASNAGSGWPDVDRRPRWLRRSVSVGALVTLTAAAAVTTPLSAGASEPSGLSEYRVLVAYNGGETRVPVPYGATEALLEIGGGDGGTTSPCRNWRQATSPNVVDSDPLGAPAGGGRWITGTLAVQGGQALLVAPGGVGQTVDITPDTVSAGHLVAQGGWGLTNSGGGSSSADVPQGQTWPDPDGAGPMVGIDAIGTIAGGGGATTVRIDDAAKSTVAIAGGGGGAGACMWTNGGAGGSNGDGQPGQSYANWAAQNHVGGSGPAGGAGGKAAQYIFGGSGMDAVLGGGGGGGAIGGTNGQPGTQVISSPGGAWSITGAGGGGSGGSTAPMLQSPTWSNSWTTYTPHSGEVRITFRGSNMVPPPENLALGGPVTASTSLENGQWGTTGLTDGLPRSLGTRPGFTSDAQPSQWWPQSATVDLGQVQPVGAVTLFPRTATGSEDPSINGAGFPRDFTIDTSADGQSWTTAGSYTIQNADGGGPTSYSVGSAAAARYVRLNVTRLGKQAPGDVGFRLQLAELAVSAPGGGNVALNAAVSSPDALNGYGFAPAALTDGQTNAVAGNAGYSSNPPYTENGGAPSVTVDLGSVQSVGRLVLYPRLAAAHDPADVTGAGFPKTIAVNVSKDGTNWQVVGVFDNQSADDGTPRSYDLARHWPTDALYDYQARYVKVSAVQTGRVAGDGVPRLQLSELQVFAPATSAVSQGKAVSAESSLDFGAAGSFDRAQLTDGVTGSDARHGYTSAGHLWPAVQEWVSVDLGAHRTISQVALYPRVAFGAEGPGVTGASFPKAFQIQVSDDGTNWRAVGSYTDQQADDGKVRLYPVSAGTTARYVKVLAEELGRPAPGDNGNYRLQLAEMTVVGS